MTLIGITGGIGSGKSTFSKVIETLGYKVYNCDIQAKYLMISDEKLKQEITKLFGTNAYIDNKLNNKYIAELVFNNKKLLEALNQAVHPAVKRDIAKWELENITDDFLFIESAILIESGFNTITNYSINITAPESLRIKRVCKRDNIDKQSVKNRISNQLSDQVRNKICNFNIFCDDNHSITKQALEILEILNRSKLLLK